MRLVYIATGKEVRVGDRVLIDNVEHLVRFFREPAHPASSGKVSVVAPGSDGPASDYNMEYYVSIIGAEWIEREDRS
jgi:hypothetical protein